MQHFLIMHVRQSSKIFWEKLFAVYGMNYIRINGNPENTNYRKNG